MKNEKKQNSLWARLMFSIVLPLLFVVLALEYGSIVVAMQLQISDAQVLNAELMQTVGKNYDEMNQTVKSCFNLITMDEDLQELLSRSEYGSDGWINDNWEIKSVILDKTLLIDNINAIYIYDAQGRLRTFWQRSIKLGTTSSLYPNINKSWCDPSGRITARMDGEYLLYVRRINSRKNLEPIGYCLLIYDRDAFNVNSDKMSSRKVIVKDGNGRIISHNGANQTDAMQIARAVDALGADFEGRAEIPTVGSAIISQYTSRVNGWHTISVVAVNQIVRSSEMLVRILIGMGVLCTALGLGICIWLANRQIIRPLQHIMEALHRVDEGDYSQRLDIRTGDELEQLALSINEMLSRTDNLINQVLRDKLLHKEMQLEALQAQVNPHLLHNVLECINWLAEFGRKEEIRSVTLALSRLMQSLCDAPRFVTLEEELEYTQCFLSIYDILLEKRLTYTITTDVERGLRIPRLTIQPLVENAVIHGIKQSMRPGHIDINVTDAQQGVLISILDDGVGMDEGMMRRINAFADGTGSEEGLGVGLRNVIKRIHLLYGGEAMLRCTSDPTWGTLFDLVLPYEMKEKLPDVEGSNRG